MITQEIADTILEWSIEKLNLAMPCEGEALEIYLSSLVSKNKCPNCDKYCIAICGCDNHLLD